MQIRVKIHSLCVIAVLMLAACGSQPLFEDTYDFRDHSWGSGESPAFTFVANDTVTPYNFVVTLRTTPDYEYSNLWVFMYTQNPNGTQRKDTLNFPLAEPSGKWIGKNTGSVIEHELLIGFNRSFPESGEYLIRFEQAIPDPEVKHVLDLGLRIEPTQHNK
jgi:gliding motility-associated lipoprotein GldH